MRSLPVWLGVKGREGGAGVGLDTVVFGLCLVQVQQSSVDLHRHTAVVEGRDWGGPERQVV